MADATLELTVSNHEGETVLSAAGELDVNTAPELREHLARLAGDGARRIVVDLTDVSFIDSTGLGVLVGVLKRVLQHNGELLLQRPRPAARKVFDITGLDQVFTIID